MGCGGVHGEGGPGGGRHGGNLPMRFEVMNVIVSSSLYL